LHAIWIHRISNILWKRNLKLFARMLSGVSRFLTGIEIHPAATIGNSVFIDHGMGVVIGETAEVGDNCLLYQGVVLGGVSHNRGKRHPTLGENVVVGAGAILLGPIYVGNHSRVGAGSVLLEDVPENTTVVGIPARPTRGSNEELQHADIVDPVETRLIDIERRLAELENG
jgi:serine O-acetyltransferase